MGRITCGKGKGLKNLNSNISLNLQSDMSYTNKIYVAFDADNDIRYYRLMQAWKQSDHTSFNFYDAHDLNNLMPYSTEETIKDKLRERLQNLTI